MKSIQFLGRGVLHEDSDKPCQDRLRVYKTKDGREIRVIADGCSGSRYGGEAAQVNCDTAVKIHSNLKIAELSKSGFLKIYPELSKYLAHVPEDDIKSCYETAFAYELSRLAEKLDADADPSEFLATVLITVTEPENTFVAHIGDGNIVFFDKEGNIAFRSAEENGEDSTHTFFTLCDDFKSHYHCFNIPTESYHSFVMFSDGPQTLLGYEYDLDIAKGAYELVMKPILEGKVKSSEELINHLKTEIAHAMYYVFDDWSIIAAFKCSESLPELNPVSLKAIFTEACGEGKNDAEQTNGDTESPADESNVISEEDSTPVKRKRFKKKRKWAFLKKPSHRKAKEDNI